LGCFKLSSITFHIPSSKALDYLNYLWQDCVPMKRIIFLGLAFLIFGCSGASKDKSVSEHEMYHEKRVNCEYTKTTNETANVTQCFQNNPDRDD